MLLTELKICDFRNIAAATLSFTDGVNLLYGNNAQGKTNALEAIYYFARGRSFRTPRDADLIRAGCDFFSLDLKYKEGEKEKKLAYRIAKRERIREKNGIRVSSPSEMIGHFRAVLFCPEHLSLVKGSPDERRAFLNIGISQCYPAYLPLYSSYMKILDQRNSLLKMAQKGLPVEMEELLVWSERLSEYAARIYRYRKDYIEKIEKYARPYLLELSDGKEDMTLLYESDVTEDEDPLLVYKRKTAEALDREIAVGYSLYGVHRDDLDIRIGGHSSRIFASQGQQRSIVLSLKEAEGEVSRDISGEYPVFLYDDVLSELDEKRQEKLLYSSGKKQIVVTSCTEEHFGESVRNRIYTEGGQYDSSHR